MKSKRNLFSQPKSLRSVKSLADFSYVSFDQLDGDHSFRKAAPHSYVDYAVRSRPGGEVFYFNFRLAREMGLLPKDHPDEMNPSLEQKLLETFAIVIINEHDLIHKKKFDSSLVKPKKFMATRYLQLQHPNKQGKTSGDGRGIWNGEFKQNGITWDVSSSGTGATCLSPAHAITKNYFKTGDKKVGYGNGYNCVSDGVSAALMSEIFYHREIETEQTLVIISFEAGTSINVRAGKNLFRPAHFFRQLKLGQKAELASSIDFFIDRQVSNRDWPESLSHQSKKDRYHYFAKQMALTFSKIAAQFESEYIFCWLDWDGDNVLANGGIIDYGSVRQFGLYHWEYRYDDVDRMSTNIPEQRLKARYIVQNFLQATYYLTQGRKKRIKSFQKHALLNLFDRHFEKVLLELMLAKLGFSLDQSAHLMESRLAVVKRLKKHHAYFEKTKSTRGVYEIADGITCDAIFCMADLHRELPKACLQNKKDLPASEFIALCKSSYAKPSDLRLTHYRRQQASLFQKNYRELMQEVSEKFHAGSMRKALLELTMRASLANVQDRITGDGVLHVTASVIRNRHALNFAEKQNLLNDLIHHQLAKPSEADQAPPLDEAKASLILLRNLRAIRHYREGF